MGTKGKHWKLKKAQKENISKGKKIFFKNNPSKKPIPPSRKGTKLTEAHKKNISLKLKGKRLAEKSSQWKGGISQDYYRRIAFENLPNICEVCGSLNQLRVHHKNQDRKDNDLNNLIIVCKSCHNKIHEKWKNLHSIKRLFNKSQEVNNG